MEASEEDSSLLVAASWEHIMNSMETIPNGILDIEQVDINEQHEGNQNLPEENSEEDIEDESFKGSGEEDIVDCPTEEELWYDDDELIVVRREKQLKKRKNKSVCRRKKDSDSRVIDVIIEEKCVEDGVVDNNDNDNRPPKHLAMIAPTMIPEMEDEDAYDSTSDYDSPEYSEDDDNDEAELRRKKDICVTFDPTTDMFNIELLCGMKFSDPFEFKEVLREFGIAKGKGLWFKKNTKDQVEVRCAKNCPWRCYASWMSRERTFQIKSLIDKHICGRVFNGQKLATSKWLAKKYHQKIIANPRWKLEHFRVEVKEKYAINVTKCQVRRAKIKAMGEVGKVMEEHYAMTWSYAAEIKRSNPGSYVVINVDRPDVDKQGFFKRIYICLDALKKGWMKGCRPVLGLDGVILKSFVKGQLLTAVGRDANNQNFPLAYAVVEAENTDSWLWFLGLLVEDVNTIDGIGWTIITDQQKGLLNAVAEILPRAEHRCCGRHIYANLRKNAPSKKVKQLFWKCAKIGTLEEYESIMEEIKEASKPAYTYLTQKQDPKQWCRAFFECKTSCDSVENNMTECFNGVLVEARYKPMLTMLEDIRRYLMIRIQKRRELAEKWAEHGELCPRIAVKLEKSKLASRFWDTTWNGASCFEVNNMNGREGFVVDLGQRKCKCKQWDLSGIPCAHACAAIYYKCEDPLNYVSDWYKVSKMKESLEFFIQPLNGAHLWPKTACEPFLPPLHRRMPGRPKKARRRETHENEDKAKKGQGVSRVGRIMHCTNCGSESHNKRTCKELVNHTTKGPQKLKVRRTKQSAPVAPKRTREGTSSAPVAPKSTREGTSSAPVAPKRTREGTSAPNTTRERAPPQPKRTKERALTTLYL